MVGPISDTGEILRGVSDSARESYHRRSPSRYVFYSLFIVLFLAVAVIGIRRGDSLGIVAALGSAFGIALVSIWLCIH